MQFMYFANEVRDFGQIPKGEPKVPKREIELANSLMDKMSAEEFEPEKYHDEYRERFLGMVDQKVKGRNYGCRATSTGAPRESRRLNGRAKTKPGRSSATKADSSARGEKDGAQTTEGLKRKHHKDHQSTER